MKKIFFIFFIPFLMNGCGDNSVDKKNEYIARCTSGDSSEKMESFCECCYIQLLDYEESSSEFVNAIRDNCMSLLY